MRKLNEFTIRIRIAKIFKKAGWSVPEAIEFLKMMTSELETMHKIQEAKKK